MLEGTPLPAPEHNVRAADNCESELDHDATTTTVGTTYLLAHAPTGNKDSSQDDQEDERLVTEQDLAIRSNLVF
jgi:hypothetical protein